MSGDSKINVTTGNPGQSSYGVGNSRSVINMSDNANITVALGDGTVESKAMIGTSLTMSGKSSVNLTAGNAPSGSYGLWMGTLTMTDDAVLVANAGDATSTTDGQSYGILGKAIISSNASIIATSGEGGTAAAAIRTGDTWEINGGTIEAISPAQAFGTAPTLSEDIDFFVKAGSSKAKSSRQTDAQIADASTYTGNEYNLIKVGTKLDSIAITGIDTPTEGEEFDDAYNCDAEGIAEMEALSWTPAGDIVAGKEYTASMNIKAADGYVFTDATTATVDGKAATVKYNDNGSITITYVMTAKAAPTTEAATTSTEATTEEPTTTSTEATTTSTEATTTQAPEGSTTDTTEATTAATTEAPDNSDANVKTGDSTPLNVMIVLMLLAGIGMVVVAKKKTE